MRRFVAEAAVLAVLAVLVPAIARAAPPSARVGIGVSIGPPSAKPAVIRQIFEGAARQDAKVLFRFNLARKHLPQARKEARAVLATAQQLGIKKQVPLLFDLPGAKMRIGRLAAGEPALLRDGQAFTLRYGVRPQPTTSSEASVNYPRLGEYAKVGGEIDLRWGEIKLAVTAVAPNKLETRVVRGGKLRAFSGVTVVGEDPAFPPLSSRDRHKIKVAVASGATHVGVSMAESGKQLVAVRRALARLGASDVKVVAKIESLAALEHLPELAREADMLMVARGDLLSAVRTKQALHRAEKQIAAAARRSGKPFFEATGFEGPEAAREVAIAMKQKPMPKYLVLKGTSSDPDPLRLVGELSKLLAPQARAQ